MFRLGHWADFFWLHCRLYIILCNKFTNVRHSVLLLLGCDMLCYNRKYSWMWTHAHKSAVRCQEGMLCYWLTDDFSWLLDATIGDVLFSSWLPTANSKPHALLAGQQRNSCDCKRLCNWRNSISQLFPKFVVTSLNLFATQTQCCLGTHCLEVRPKNSLPCGFLALLVGNFCVMTKLIDHEQLINWFFPHMQISSTSC